MSKAFQIARRCGVTVNGRISAEVRARPGRPVTHEIAGFLDRMDGERRFAVWFWPLPDGQTFDDVDLRSGPTTFLQAVGNRDRMTVELRIVDDAGQHHYVLGHEQSAPEAQATERIRWRDHETLVLKTEVFSAAEAVPLFLAFWQVDDVPEDYTRRHIRI